MPDVFLHAPAAGPADVLLWDPTHAYVSGTSAGEQLAQEGSGLGILAFVGSSSGEQPAQDGSGAGVLEFVGSSGGDQAGQDGDGIGAVVLPGISITADHDYGWVRIEDLIRTVPLELEQPRLPPPVRGMSEGDQPAQDGQAVGTVVQPAVTGISSGRQASQSGGSAGWVSTDRKVERELIELLLLDAA
jgi:hypothetical protein